MATASRAADLIARLRQCVFGSGLPRPGPKDNSVRKEDVVEVKAPTASQSSRLSALAVDLAQSMRARGDDDEAEQSFTIQLNIPQIVAARLTFGVEGNESSMMTSSGATATTAAKSRARPKGKAKARMPQVAAASARKETLKQFVAATNLAKTAKQQAEQVLQQVEETYGSLEAASDQDNSVRTMRHRLECLQILSDGARARPNEAASASWKEKLCEDEFFHEQGWSAASIQTIGQLNYVRDVLFDMQRTSEAVEALADVHADSVVVLQTVAQALAREATQWKSNIAAVEKARMLEEKAKKRRRKKPASAREKKPRSLQSNRGSNRRKNWRARRLPGCPECPS